MKQTNYKVIRTRMAPSPTGAMHVGSLAMLLKNYAWAKRHGGQFILRIEDTDKEREVAGAIDDILRVIRDYGLDWDEGPGKGGPHEPYIQSQRLTIYKEHAKQLINSGQAYYCFCSKQRLAKVRAEQMANHQPPHYDQHCRNLSQAEVDEKLQNKAEHVIRLKVPKNKTVAFDDLLRGEIAIQTSEIDDQILLKSDGFPTYHLGVVVDDYLMGITHILRGEEWISSAPKHVLLYEAFGWEKPVFAHIPVFLNPDGRGKMSKRKGTVSARSFLDKGYLPEALLNFFMILGWARADQKQPEVMTLAEYVQEFDPQDVSVKSVVFDLKKLDWLNGVYIRQLPQAELKERLSQFLPQDFPLNKLDQILPLVVERLVTLADIEELTEFFYRPIELSEELGPKIDAPTTRQQFTDTGERLAALTEWSTEQIEQVVRSLQENNSWSRGQYFMLLRRAVTGKKATPPLFETMKVLGQKLTVQRLADALSHGEVN
ncbi:MAG TPA: glutamate--tRNA ligase [Patescibacteria group bacterium]|jgi:glutamyl-tRNA synthetase